MPPSDYPPDDLTLAVRQWLAQEVYPGLLQEPFDERAAAVWIDGSQGWVALWQSDRFRHEPPLQRMEQLKHVLFDRIKDVRWPPPEPPKPTSDRIDGQLEAHGGAFYVNGRPVLPTLCHFGEAFSAFVRKPDDVLQELDIIGDAGFHGIRFWDWLGYYAGGWRGREVNAVAMVNDAGATVTATADYYGQLYAFLRACKERGLVVHHSRGDLNSVPNQAIFEHCRRVGEVQAAVGVQVVALNEAVNECNMNIRDYSEDNLRQMLNQLMVHNPASLRALSTPPGQTEELDDLIAYAASVWYVHGYRGGDSDPVGQLRHIFSLSYDGPGKRLSVPGWQGEPTGPGGGVYGPQATSPNLLASMAAMALAMRQGWVYMSGRGVFWNGSIADQPGFHEVATVRHVLPPDIQQWSTLIHGGTTFTHERVLVADPDGLLRCDHVLNPATRQMLIFVYSRPGHAWTVSVNRPFQGTWINTATGPVKDEQRDAGATINVSFDNQTTCLMLRGTYQ